MTIKEFGNSFKNNNKRKDDIKKAGGSAALNNADFFTDTLPYKVGDSTVIDAM